MPHSQLTKGHHTSIPLAQHSASLERAVVAVQREIRSTITHALCGKRARKEWLQACLHSLRESTQPIAAPTQRRIATPPYQGHRKIA